MKINRLESNIALFIDQGAAIIAAPVSDDIGYDPAERSWFAILATGVDNFTPDEVIMNDIALTLLNTDSRPPFVPEDVKGACFFHITAQKEMISLFF